MNGLEAFLFVLVVGLMPLWLPLLLEPPSTSDLRHKRPEPDPRWRDLFPDTWGKERKEERERLEREVMITADKLTAGSITADKIYPARWVISEHPSGTLVLHPSDKRLPQLKKVWEEPAVEGAEPNRADAIPDHRRGGITQPCGPDCNHLLPPQGDDRG